MLLTLGSAGEEAREVGRAGKALCACKELTHTGRRWETRNSQGQIYIFNRVPLAAGKRVDRKSARPEAGDQVAG